MSSTHLQRTPDLAYDSALLFWRTVVNIFFREVRPRGAWNIPRDGPVILVAAPHHNQFLDPLLLASEAHRETHRRVEFLIAAKSMKRKAIGFFARLMASIPVARAADDSRAGTGRIYLSPDDPCLVLGIGTKFTTELTPRMQVLLPKAMGSSLAEVLEIISDTKVRIKKEFGGEKGTVRIREKLEELKESGSQEGTEYKRLPYVDQQEMYQHVYQRLKDGGCIGIFPEGGSHDRTDLLPLKAGVSLMALGAMANNPGLRVQIVPVGLSYFHAHRFRSRAVVEFGAAMDVPLDLVDMFKQGGPQKREAASQLLNIIYDGLKTVTVRAPDYDTLMTIQAARRLYKTPGQHLSLGQVVELNKRFIKAYLHFKDEPRIQQLRDDVRKYNRMVRDLGMRDHQVPRASRASWKTLSLLLYRVGLLAAWTVLALPGVILNGPIFILASAISRLKAKEALAASTVKLAGRDVLATWKVLISLGVAPVLYIFYAVLATAFVSRAGAPLKWKIWTPFLVIMALPLIGYAALKFGEAGMDVLKSLRPLLLALFPGHQRTLDRLRETRSRLSNELNDVINEYGPKLYDDFDEWRILVPSASVPASSGRPGLWRRKSAQGGIDAQGNLLSHPMSWLDERLFGWSHSSQRGTSAWSGTHSHDTSRMPTPEGSDEEDEGDYDNVLGYLPESGTKSPSRNRSRSLQNSYADLQKLRLTETGANAYSRGADYPAYLRPQGDSAQQHGSGEDGLRFREGGGHHGHGELRGATLVSDVPVKDIASAVDREEDLKAAAESINIRSRSR